MIRMLSLLSVFLILFSGISLGEESDPPDLKRFQSVLKWVEETKPEKLDLGETKFQPAELLRLKEALPEDAVFQYQAIFRKAEYTPDTQELDLNGEKKQISAEELKALLALLPNLKRMNVSGHRELSNKVMPDLVDAYPDVVFEWLIQLPYSHSLVSSFTAYSTMNHLDAKRFTEKSLDILRYASGMKALDMGHNDIVDISFLRFMPGLELLILADNEIRDLTPLSDLHELRYLEIFMNRFEDLSPLSACSELLDLNIVRTGVTTLDGLEGCGKLERLWAPQRKQLDEDSISRFIEAHPGCELAFGTGDATGQGWREHWRYQHYVGCFRSHVWIPFEENENAR